MTVQAGREPANVRLITIGGLREDYFITHDQQVHLHKLGGNAVYAAVGVALWQYRPIVVARVGRNYPAAWLAEMDARGLSTEGVVRLEDEQDTRTFYAYLSENERADTAPRKYFRQLGRPLPHALDDYLTSTPHQDKPNTFSPLAVRPADIGRLNLAGSLSGAHLAPAHFVTHRTVPTALRLADTKVITLDPSVRYMQPENHREVAEIVAGLDAFLPSEMEVQSFFRRDNVDYWEAAEAFGAMGAKVVVIKRGPRGQYVYDRVQKRRWHISAYPVRVVDVTGAGDAYGGAFLAGLVATGDPVEAALRGTVAAAMVVEGVGALYALDAHPLLAESRLRSWRNEVRVV